MNLQRGIVIVLEQMNSAQDKPQVGALANVMVSFFTTLSTFILSRRYVGSIDYILLRKRKFWKIRPCVLCCCCDELSYTTIIIAGNVITIWNSFLTNPYCALNRIHMIKTHFLKSKYSFFLI